MKGSASLRAFSIGMFVTATILWAASLYEGKQTASTTPEPALTEESVQQYLKEKELIALPKKEYDELLQQTKEAKEKAKAPSSPAPKTATIHIKQGASSLEVAKQLEQQGIIKSASEFQQYLTATQLAGKLQIGTYELSENMSFTQIGNILTK